MAGLGLNIGLSGMLSSQRALEVLGHNMSNANTPGYSRQRLQLGASRLHLQAGGGVLGNGVLASGVERASDGILSRRIVSQTAVSKALEASLGSRWLSQALCNVEVGAGLAPRYGLEFAPDAQLERRTFRFNRNRELGSLAAEKLLELIGGCRQYGGL